MILVTGGAGYIGSQFVRTYLDRFPDARVVVVDNLVEGHKESLQVMPRLSFLEEDIGDYDAMIKIFAEYDIEAVVHFAAFCYVGESQTNPGKYFDNNVARSINLFRAMEASGVRKIVFSSTCASYGVPDKVPITENHPQNPINVYGLSKLLIEKILGGYADTTGWSYVALRYFNAAGADESGEIGESHDPETHLIPLALKAAKGELDHLDIFGDDYDTPDGTCIRDYIHVADLAEAHWRSLDYLKSNSGGTAINLGTTCGASVKEVIDLCREVTGRDIKSKVGTRRAGDPARLVADATRAGTLLGWKPRFDLRKIIETAWNWETKRRY